MRCPLCPANQSTRSKVIETRRNADNTEVVRRRVCLSEAKHSFSTTERYTAGFVLKEPPREAEVFDRDKLSAAIALAAKKTSVTEEHIRRLVEDIERRVAHDGSMTARAIGEHVLEQLRYLDQVAFVRFASVFRDYNSVEEFVAEVQGLHEDPRQVIKRDGRRQDFDPMKLRRGLEKAAARLDVDSAAITAAVDRLDAEIQPGESISYKTLGTRALRELEQLHEVAAMRFASVFKSFKTLDDFQRPTDPAPGERRARR